MIQMRGVNYEQQQEKEKENTDEKTYFNQIL